MRRQRTGPILNITSPGNIVGSDVVAKWFEWVFEAAIPTMTLTSKNVREGCILTDLLPLSAFLSLSIARSPLSFLPLSPRLFASVAESPSSSFLPTWVIDYVPCRLSRSLYRYRVPLFFDIRCGIRYAPLTLSGIYSSA